jgi:bifunctional UDP-N-acetylglucosamine pyrophosphorylase/glucosamine-1-phosphate N-acetyltransferase
MADALAGTFSAVILAAGRATRFKSKYTRSKVMYPLAGVPMIEHILLTLQGMNPAQIVIVVNNDTREEVQQRYGYLYEMVLQEPQLGTGDALAAALPVLHKDVESVLVLPGDAPLVTEEALRAVLSGQFGVDASLLTFTPKELRGYGRVKQADGLITKIIEEVDAETADLRISEVNSGIYSISRQWMETALERARVEIGTTNRKGEYYLTDIVSFLRTRAIQYEPAHDLMGINDRAHLNEAENVVQTRIAERHARNGVSFMRAETSYIEMNVRIGQDAIIMPGTVLRGDTVIGDDCIIGPNTYVEDSRLGDGCRVAYSHLVGVRSEGGVNIGPYANLRPGSTLAEGVKIGNFVELKKTSVGEGSKIPHLSYVGDAKVGSKSNVGAGTITCNYDGFTKHPTKIGDRTFIGSNSTLVAPINIGNDAYTAAGSTLTKDVPDGALGLGRARQENKEGYAAKLREKKQGAAGDKETSSSEEGK